MHQPSRLPAPNITLLITVSLSVLILVLSLYNVTQVPWLGLKFQPPATSAGIEIEHIYHQPVGNTLWPGNTILALRSEDKEVIPLGKADLYKEPHQLKGYAAYRHFIDKQERIWQAMNRETVSLILDDGDAVQLNPLPSRSISSLPLHYWLINFFGIGVLLIGTTVWIYRPEQTNTRLLAIASLGFSISAFTAAIYTSRELALPGDLFRALKATNVLGVMVFGYSIVLLLWHYPTRIRRYKYLIPVVYLLIVMVWLLETLQLTPSTGLYKYAVVNVLVIALGYIQWLRTRNSPVERAALLWLVMTIIITITLAFLIYYLPILHHGEPIADITTPFGLVFILFLGLTMGVIKYRLFDLQHWWAEVWLWILTGVLILSFDAVLLYVLDLSQTPALALSLFSVGLLYFPLRQWLLQRLLFKDELSLNNHLPMMMESLFGVSTDPDPNSRFARVLTQIFDPLRIEIEEGPGKAAVMDNGLQLDLPAVDGDKKLKLLFKDRGKRLFSRADLKLAVSLRKLTITAINIQGEREKGASIERKRIMRDLHDDVAARLLSLIHAPDNSQSMKAKQALHALRETIYALDDDSGITLDEFLDEIQARLREFLDGSGIGLQWNNPGSIPERTLNPRQRINISRIIQEVVQNALKHSRCENINITTSMPDHKFHITICNNGVTTEMRDWIAGKGMNNIRNRSTEIQGTADWELENGNCCFSMSVPIAEAEENE
jgi:signal transduction histidine kinase